jgi:hypothetical protein
LNEIKHSEDNILSYIVIVTYCHSDNILWLWGTMEVFSMEELTLQCQVSALSGYWINKSPSERTELNWIKFNLIVRTLSPASKNNPPLRPGTGTVTNLYEPCLSLPLQTAWLSSKSPGVDYAMYWTAWRLYIQAIPHSFCFDVKKTHCYATQKAYLDLGLKVAFVPTRPD